MSLCHLNSILPLCLFLFEVGLEMKFVAVIPTALFFSLLMFINSQTALK